MKIELERCEEVGGDIYYAVWTDNKVKTFVGAERYQEAETYYLKCVARAKEGFPTKKTVFSTVVEDK